MLRSTIDTQHSWDWEADLAFALQADDIAPETLALLKRLVRGSIGVAPVAMMMHDESIAPNVTRRRLTALRALVKQGLVRTYWCGTGPGGRTAYGVGRTRGYQLVAPSGTFADPEDVTR